jgi:hypothetical protein
MRRALRILDVGCSNDPMALDLPTAGPIAPMHS